MGATVSRAGSVLSRGITTAHVAVVLAAWSVLAVLVARKGGLSFMPAPAFVPPLTAALVAALWAVPGLRAWQRAVGLRTLILLHLTRFVGLYFLMLSARGELPREFAVPAAAGDIAIAIGAAIVAVLCVPARTVARRRVLFAWNVLGLADIMFVVATAARLTRADPISMSALSRLPLVLLPTVVVPLVIASHVVLFARLRRDRPDT